jgi:hypothetical protein
MKEVMNSVALIHEKNKEGFQLKITSDIPNKTLIKYEIEGIVKRGGKFIRVKLISDSIQLGYLQNQLIFDHVMLSKFFISNSIESFHVRWSVNGQIFSKIILLNDVKFQIAKQGKVKISIKKIDKKNKTLIVSIDSKDRIDHFWMYSTIGGIRFEENDLQLFPGKREVKVKYQTKPRKANFHWLGLENSLVRF